MIILGIDPGTATTGYGVVESKPLRHIAHGIVVTKKESGDARRLELIYDGVSQLLKEYKPDVVAVEKLFFAKNVKTAMAVGQARGVILLAIEQSGTPYFEYAPTEVKSAVSGYGHAGKGQMQELMQRVLNLEEIPKPDDAADALAIAVTHANTNQRLK